MRNKKFSPELGRAVRFVSGSIPKFAEIAFRHHPLALFAGMLDAIFEFACAQRKLGGDVVAAPRRVHAAWRVVLDRLPDPEPMIIHLMCYPGDRRGNIRLVALL